MSGVVRCRLDDATTRTAMQADDYRGCIEARHLSEVTAALAEVEAANRAGLVAIGLVCYEAAPAFDAALTVVPSDRPAGLGLPSAAAAVPLVWFGLFGRLSPVPPVATPAGYLNDGRSWEWETDRAEFEAAVVEIHEQIAAGMTYQVNLTTRLRRRFRGELDDAASATYAQVVGAQRGAFNAYIETPAWAVACGSPELFFDSRRRRVTSKPMKGTARRGRTPSEDDALATQLAGSDKERAENVMIVDLMRNDLGRVAQIGTVGVSELFALERYRTVWQMTSQVSCDVPPETGLVALLQALFPAGSVTGAPKASTMSIISSLEKSVRGPYCGAIGYASAEAMRFAVGIRTVVLDASTSVAEFGVGSGITWYASAEAEWAELGAKATVLGYDSSA